MVTEKESGLREINKAFDLLTNLINGSLKDLSKDIAEANKDLSALQADTKNLVNNFQDLSSIIREDRISFSEISTKVAVMDNELKSLKETFSNLEKDLEKKDSDKSEKSKTVSTAATTGKWQFYVAMSTGIISLITAIIMHFLK